MNHSITLSISATALVVSTLFLSSCNDDMQADREPVSNDRDALSDTAVPASQRSGQAAPAADSQRSADSAPSLTDAHAKGAQRTAVGDPVHATGKAAGHEGEEDEQLQSLNADGSAKPADNSRLAADRMDDRESRMGEESKGVVGQTEDRTLAELNRQEAAKHAPDNSGRNAVDRNANSVTPIDQGEAQSDIDITAAIRRAIIADKNLSMYAKNIKIITRDGAVTLRGPVLNPSEMMAIREIAMAVPGVRSVDNNLEIAEK